MPFLNSFMDLPSERAISGSLLPPNMTSTMTRMTSSSCVPSPNMVRSSSVAETSGQRGDAQSRGGARQAAVPATDGAAGATGDAGSITAAGGSSKAGAIAAIAGVSSQTSARISSASPQSYMRSEERRVGKEGWSRSAQG